MRHIILVGWFAILFSHLSPAITTHLERIRRHAMDSESNQYVENMRGNQ